jgi:transposase
LRLCGAPRNRKGAEGLAALVRETMRTDPFSVVYVFRAKRADRVKLIFWDGTGVVLVAKRLEDGEFRWPKVQDGVMRLSAAQASCSRAATDRRAGHGELNGKPPQVLQNDRKLLVGVIQSAS